MTKWKKLDGQFNALRTLYADCPSEDTREPNKIEPRPSNELKTPWGEPKLVTTRRKTDK